MSIKRDYYEVLGVNKNASDKDIKSAFRKMSRKWHPDMQSGKSDEEKKSAEDKFKECAEAYEVLSDKDKRSAYDQFGFDGPRMSANGGGFGGFNMGDFMRRHSGMFSSFFGGNPFEDDDFTPFGSGFFNTRKSNQHPDPNSPEDGRDVRIKMDLDFNDALFGCTKELKIKLSKECNSCHGSGVKPGSSVDVCKTCKGHGVVEHRSQHGFMMSITTSTCPACGGSGTSFDKCLACGGQKRVPAEKQISTNIPAGIETGQKLRVKGAGECGTCGGKDGDLYISVNVGISDLFERNGINLMITQPVSAVTASIGDKIDVITPYGFYKLKIPAGTSSGDVLIIPGKGIKTSQGIGDLYVTVVVEPFYNLTKDQEKLLESFSKSLKPNNMKSMNDLKQKADKFLKSVEQRASK